MLEKIDGIIIKSQDYGETHKIITLISKKLGKFNAIARGAKKPKSRMAAVTQPFIHGQFLVYVSRGLSTIQQGEIINSFRSIREDIIKTAFTAYIMELTDKLMESQNPDPFLYDELYRTLSWIADEENAEIPIMMYELKLFNKGGFAPVLNQCVDCSRNEGPFAFSVVEGGLLCNRCMHMDKDAVPIPNPVSKVLNILAHVGIDRIGTISVKEKNIILIRRLLDEYYDRYGGYYLKTRNFLKQLDHLR